MRKHNSLFNQVCTFINVRPIGTVFTNDELYSSVDENPSAWKRREKDLNYTTRFYRYWLMKAGVLEKFGKKTWKIVAHVPDHVESHHVWGRKRRIPYQLWHISHENKINKPSDEEITIFKIIDKHVEHVNIFKTQVGALLSTGSYFEDEMDAWYFLSIGTGVAVESLKDTWKKTQDFANEIVEMDKSHLEQEENEIIERLSGLLLTIGIKSNFPKTIYQFISGKLFAKKVSENTICNNDNFENESLKRLLQLEAGHKLPWTILAEDILESIEMDTYYDLPMIDSSEYRIKNEVTKTSEVKIDKSFITIDDIRGREVYYFRHKEWYKGKVATFNISATVGENPTYGTVKLEGDDASSWIKYSDLLFSKEEVIAQFTQTLNSL